MQEGHQAAKGRQREAKTAGCDMCLASGELAAQPAGVKQLGQRPRCGQRQLVSRSLLLPCLHHQTMAYSRNRLRAAV